MAIVAVYSSPSQYLGLIPQMTQFSYEHKMNQVTEAKFSIDANASYADLIQPYRLIQIRRRDEYGQWYVDWFGIIIKIEKDFKGIISVGAQSFERLLANSLNAYRANIQNRTVFNNKTAWEITTSLLYRNWVRPTETARIYYSKHGIPGYEDLERGNEDIVLADNPAITNPIPEFRVAWKTLLDSIVAVCEHENLAIRFSWEFPRIVFNLVKRPLRNNTAITFSPRFQNVGVGTVTWDATEEANIIIAAGAGEGTGRETAVVEALPPSELDFWRQSEKLLNATDLKTESGLVSRAETKIKFATRKYVLEPEQSEGYRYGLDYRFGDLVTYDGIDRVETGEIEALRVTHNGKLETIKFTIGGTFLEDTPLTRALQTLTGRICIVEDMVSDMAEPPSYIDNSLLVELNTPNLTLQNRNDEQISITWERVPNTHTYSVYRAVNIEDEFAGPIAQDIEQPAPPQYKRYTEEHERLSYVDTTAEQGVAYIYYVQAKSDPEVKYNPSNKEDEYRDSELSNPVVTQLLAVLGRPEVAAVAIVDGVRLVFAPILGATSYDIFRSVGTNNPTAYAGNIDINYDNFFNVFWEDTGLVNNTVYYYYIVANTTNVDFISKSQSSTVPYLALGILDMPVFSTLRFNGDNTPIDNLISWVSITDATGYELQRKRGKDPWITIYAGSVTQYTDSDIVNNADFLYRTRANASQRGDSAWSDEGTITTGYIQLTMPVFPATGLTLGTGTATLNWDDVLQSIYYDVEYRLLSDSSWSTARAFDSDTVLSIPAGEYAFRIIAVGDSDVYINSEPSDIRYGTVT